MRPRQRSNEVTAACDARCIHCPRERMDRPSRAMAFPLFKRIIDEAAELKVPELRPNGYGELLVLKDLERYLEYIRSKRHNFKIAINTNGNRMTDEKIELFIKTRVNAINISIDGATAETAEAVRVGLDFHQIEGNVRSLLETRRRLGVAEPKVRVSMIAIDRNRHEVSQFLARWTGVADFVGVEGFSNRVGSVSPAIAGADRAEGGTRARSCAMPFRDLNIWADGKAVLCCNDWNEEHVVGDLNRQSMREVWLGQQLTLARRLHRAGRGADIDLCRRCNYWEVPGPGIRLWD